MNRKILYVLHSLAATGYLLLSWPLPRKAFALKTRWKLATFLGLKFDHHMTEAFKYARNVVVEEEDD